MPYSEVVQAPHLSFEGLDRTEVEPLFQESVVVRQLQDGLLQQIQNIVQTELADVIHVLRAEIRSTIKHEIQMPYIGDGVLSLSHGHRGQPVAQIIGSSIFARTNKEGGTDPEQAIPIGRESGTRENVPPVTGLPPSLAQDMMTAGSEQTSFECASEEFLPDTHAEASRHLRETLWEIGMIGGLRDEGHLDIVVIVVVFFVNLFAQVCFCGIIWKFLLDDAFPDVDDIKKWRETAAHSQRFLEASYGVSLNSQVCNGDDALVLATSQRQLHDLIGDYTRTLGSMHAGVITFGLASLVWYLEVCKELGEAFTFGFYLCMLRVSRTTTVHSSSFATNLLTIAGGRRICCMVVTLVRIGIICLVLIMGILWLANTTELEEMIMNCAALTIVFHVDKSLYAAFVPGHIKSALRKMAPMSMSLGFFSRSSSIAVAEGIYQLVHVIGMSCLIFGVIRLKMSPRVDKMLDLDAELCDGDQDFVWVTHPLGVVVAAETRPFSSVLGSDAESYSRQAVRQIIWQKGPPLAYMSKQTPLALDQWEVSPSAIKFASSIHICLDIDDGAWASGNGTWLAQWLKYRTGIVHARSCSDVKQFCTTASQSLYLVRTACPITCGCRGLKSGLFLIDPGFGCPISCIGQTTNYNYIQRCDDEPSPTLQNMSSWRSFWDQYLALAAEVLLKVQTGVTHRVRNSLNFTVFQDRINAVKNGGCRRLLPGVVKPPLEYDLAYFCSEENSLSTNGNVKSMFDLSTLANFSWTLQGSVAYFCPRSCRCRSTNNSWPCPTQLMRSCAQPR